MGFVDSDDNPLGARFSNNLGFLGMTGKRATTVVADAGNNRIRTVQLSDKYMTSLGSPRVNDGEVSSSVKTAASLADAGYRTLAAINTERATKETFQLRNFFVFFIQAKPVCTFGFYVSSDEYSDIMDIFNVFKVPSIDTFVMGASNFCTYQEGRQGTKFTFLRGQVSAITDTGFSVPSRLVDPQSFCGPVYLPSNICGLSALTYYMLRNELTTGCFYVVDGTMLRRVVGGRMLAIHPPPSTCTQTRSPPQKTPPPPPSRAPLLST